MIEILISTVIVILFVTSSLHGKKVSYLENKVADLDWDITLLGAEVKRLRECKERKERE